jgi:DNA-directed RNA polymerase specialized sigma24 family protein
MSNTHSITGRETTNETDPRTMSSTATTLRAEFSSTGLFGRQARRTAIRNAIAAGLSPEQAAQITGLDLGYVRSLLRTVHA